MKSGDSVHVPKEAQPSSPPVNPCRIVRQVGIASFSVKDAQGHIFLFNKSWLKPINQPKP